MHKIIEKLKTDKEFYIEFNKMFRNNKLDNILNDE
jgi:hypothetical protein